MTPILTAPGIIFGLMLLCVGWFQIRYASMIDSDDFMLSRRRVAVGIRRLTGLTFALALAVAVVPAVLHLAVQHARQPAVDELNATVEAQRRHIEQVELLLTEQNQKLEQARQQMAPVNRDASAAAAPSAAAATSPTESKVISAAKAYIRFSNSSGVFLRSAPAGHIIATLKNGAALTVDATQPTFSGGHYWTKVRTADGLDGWVVKEAVSTESS
jgi:uncharacterized coiled-coil protein SlyX